MPAKRKRGGGRPREDEREQHHEAILDAATAVFLEHGYARASMSDIATRAGASKATLYARFPSKSTLFAALMDRRSRALQARVALEADHLTAPPAKVLCELWTGVLRIVTDEENHRLHRLVQAESDRFPELAAAFWQNNTGRGLEVLKRYLQMLVERGTLVIEDLDLTTEQFLGTLLGGTVIRLGYRQPLFFRDDEELTRWVRSGVDMFLRAHAPTTRKR
jgi:TetR/AcrR family transcriptional regulator, mexJK operon transcriptional repressor